MRKCKALVLSIAVSALFMSCGEKEASIRFNISGAVALGATGGTGSSVNRSVLFSREAEEDPVSIVKLTESGEVENATEITGEVDLANVNSIFKSPYSKDMYLWFDGLTRNTLNNGPVLTPLVCIHNDNTYTDLLRQETKYSNYLTFRKQDNIDFDDKGNAYFIGDDGGPYEIYVYKFDVNTRERTTLYSQISNYDPSNTLDVIW